ncbi:MAG: alkaline phosphatase [Clostridia bacterium]|nr:alkaline phosphatase [Clostridia bacterium]
MHKHLKLRSLSLFLVLLMLLAAFASCSENPPAETTDANSNSDTEGGSTSEVVTTEAETEPTFIDLFENGTTQYKLICPEDPSDRIFGALIELQTAMTTLTGVEMEFSTDFYNPFQTTLPETGYEILIGNTNRVETAEAKAKIRGKDFIIYENNGRIAILGGTEEKTLEAVTYFIENYLNPETKNVTVQENTFYVSRYNYDLGVISIDGAEIMQYNVVVPKNPDTLFPYFAALNLIDFLETEAGAKLSLVYDDEEPTEYEIVIGETNRAESQSAMKTSLADNQYILKKVGKSIYMYGKDYMIGGATSEFVNHYILGSESLSDNSIEITGLPSSNMAKSFSFPKKATSALILIGDGMGQNHVDSTYKGKNEKFLAEYLDNVGTCTTFQYGNNEFSSSYTDSAASATALATGYKTKNSYLGKDHNKVNLLNVRELASSLGAKTAVLTSDKITGATPAGFLCHHTSRNDTKILQNQINQLLARNSATYDPNLLYATSVNDNRNDLLPETRKILNTLQDKGETFFAMIEEAHIDKESHSNKLAAAQACVVRYNDVIGYCIQFVMLHPETALVITADHECGGLELEDGKFVYNVTTHTNDVVPVYAIGPGTEMFKGAKVDNTDIGKFLASAYTDAHFGN